MKKLGLIILTVVFLLITGCGSGGGGSTTDPDDNNGNVQDEMLEDIYNFIVMLNTEEEVELTLDELKDIETKLETVSKVDIGSTRRASYPVHEAYSEGHSYYYVASCGYDEYGIGVLRVKFEISGNQKYIDMANSEDFLDIIPYYRLANLIAYKHKMLPSPSYEDEYENYDLEVVEKITIKNDLKNESYIYFEPDHDENLEPGTIEELKKLPHGLHSYLQIKVKVEGEEEYSEYDKYLCIRTEYYDYLYQDLTWEEYLAIQQRIEEYTGK